MMTLPEMDANAFEQTASTYCKRWSEKSLRVARALLVDRESITKVANDNDMSPQQANVVRARFVEKTRKMRLAQFMRHEMPGQGGMAAMKPFLQEMLHLRNNGYTDEQIAAYLTKNGVHATGTTVRNFMRKTT
jgi:hypothetical protein